MRIESNGLPGIIKAVMGQQAPIASWSGIFERSRTNSVGIIRKASDAYAAGRVLGGICHGPLGLLRGRTPDGKLIVKGRRLTAHGLRFTRAQCNTCACSASRATFFTGLYPAQHGVRNLIACDNPKDPAQRRLPILPSHLPNLATVLAAAGYHVELKGKFHLSRPMRYNHEMKRHYWSEADTRHMAERYGFHGVDAQILKLLGALDRNGLTNDTFVLRTSDHGELGMSHGRMRQKFYNVYRETLSVPLIVSNPRLYPEPRVTDALASLIDVLPTLATVTGVPEPHRYGFEGRDLTPILSNPAAGVQDVLHFTYEDDVFPVKGADCIRAIVERDWKYAVYYDPYTGAPPEYEMYDLANDPLELTNLAHDAHRTPASDAERARLHRRLSEVMHANGTLPDEICWPDETDYPPASQAGADARDAGKRRAG
ncbi:MAG TPA: sulfatase-like hydrolase/transferase [Vicinamibacterales bacterium]|nr:sulfatase-like hydrolase/transferase [Vicinamibacterales bacterium]